MIILYIFLGILALIFLILAPVAIIMFLLMRFGIRSAEEASKRQALFMQRMFRPDTNEIDRKRSQGE